MKQIVMIVMKTITAKIDELLKLGTANTWRVKIRFWTLFRYKFVKTSQTSDIQAITGQIS